MKERNVCLAALLVFSVTVATSQTWETLELSGFKVDFPAEHVQSVTSSGRIYTHDGGNIYLTITSLPDTSKLPAMTQLERSRFYAATTATVLRRLGGRLQEVRDTMIGDQHLHFSAVQVQHNDTAFTRYELLQYYKRDTLHGFSCQYETFDPESVGMRDRFFTSIDLEPGDELPGKGLFAIVGIVIVVLALLTGFLIYRSRRTRRSARRKTRVT